MLARSIAVNASAGIYQSATAPANPPHGMLWLDTDEVASANNGTFIDEVTGKVYKLVAVDGQLVLEEVA